ncbi:MAG: WecB/TagA/CpsF family glycosyltransferase [Xanthomonadales bacterium]|nr:WecB/TagA/CpsF family glycosyltransferase [Xanthomonadales bacterium]
MSDRVATGSQPGEGAKVDVLGIPVSPVPIGDFARRVENRPPGRPLTISFVNPHACYLARVHPGYTGLLRGIDVVACDGAGMVLAAHLQGHSGVRRESFDFTSMAGPVFRWASETGVAVQLVGGKVGVSQRAAQVLREQYPDLRIIACFSGYGADVEAALDEALKGDTGLVVCGMGAPRQERHLHALTERGWQGVGMTCGGFFDQVSRSIHYYPAWVDRLNLRFAYRLVNEPARLWRRYLWEYRFFVYGLLGALVAAPWRRDRKA